MITAAPQCANCAPVVLFVYTRPEHTKRTLEALSRNHLANETDLIVYSDGPKSLGDLPFVREVRDVVRVATGFKSVKLIERATNQGLSKSIIEGVTATCRAYGCAIVLEDDIVTSPYFLKYMNEGLNIYRNEAKVASIHGYVYPISESLPETFFLRGADCWGWATWTRAWELFNENANSLLNELKGRSLSSHFDFNRSYPYMKMLEAQAKGEIDSWAIRWYASAFLADTYTLYPGQSLVTNIGHDNTGTHSAVTDMFDTTAATREIKVFPLEIADNFYARKQFELFFRKNNSFVCLIKKFVLSLINKY